MLVKQIRSNTVNTPHWTPHHKKKKKIIIFSLFYLDLCLLAESAGLPLMEPAMASSIVERSRAREAGEGSVQAGFKTGKRDFPWWSSG